MNAAEAVVAMSWVVYVDDGVGYAADSYTLEIDFKQLKILHLLHILLYHILNLNRS